MQTKSETLFRSSFGLCFIFLRYFFVTFPLFLRLLSEGKAKFYRRPIEHLSKTYRTSIEDLSNRLLLITDYWRRLQTLRYRILYRTISFLMVNYLMIFFLSIDFSDCLESSKFFIENIFLVEKKSRWKIVSECFVQQ